MDKQIAFLTLNQIALNILVMLLFQATASYDAASDRWDMFGPDEAGGG